MTTTPAIADALEMPQGVDALAIGCYTIILTFTEPADLPGFKGATMRGAFGVALKRAVCVTRQAECASCMLATTCLFPQLFDFSTDATDVIHAGRRTPPRAFVIEPPTSAQHRYEPGEQIVFGLVLFGTMIEKLPYFVFALAQLEIKGIGRRHARFRLTSVQEQLPAGATRELLQPATQKLIAPTATLNAAQWIDFAAARRRRKISLQLLTPVRIKAQRQLHADLSFATFWIALHRRIHDLYTFHAVRPLQIEWQPYFDLASQVTVADADVHWYEFERMSRRQQVPMTLGGLLGTISFSGPLSHFMPWLQLGEILHVGKNTTFGFGKYVIATSAP